MPHSTGITLPRIWQALTRDDIHFSSRVGSAPPNVVTDACIGKKVEGTAKFGCLRLFLSSDDERVVIPKTYRARHCRWLSQYFP